MQKPGTPEQLAEMLREAAEARGNIKLGGNFSKDALGGLGYEPGVTISTSAMNRLLAYDPRDLTVSVEA